MRRLTAVQQRFGLSLFSVDNEGSAHVVVIIVLTY